jgi:hypothetical protein
LLAPAVTRAASAVYVTPAGELRADDYRNEPDKIEIRFEPAQGATPDRFLVENQATASAYNPTCEAVSPLIVACPAASVSSIGVGLGAGNDVLDIAAVGGAAVPARYPTRAKGGEGNDVIKSAAGNDRLLGEAGNDIVAGGLGEDTLSGGAGGDGLLGFDGNDDLGGGAGKDALFGQKGRDSLAGGAGNDVLIARDGQPDAKIDCGPGSRQLQRAVVDRRDPRARNCTLPKKK